MRSSLEQVLDACIAQLNSGEDLEAVLAAHPQEADELRPMLVAAALVRVHIPPPTHKTERKGAFLASVEARRREIEVTEGYVVEIKAGVPLAELLSRAAPEIRPLIAAASRLFRAPVPAPDAERMAAGKQRLMAMAAARHAARAGRRVAARRSWTGVLRGLLPTPTATRPAWSSLVAAVVTVALLGVGAAGVTTVAASSLPGDSLYEVKEIGRSAQLLFAFDPARRAELHLTIGAERLAEMEALAEAGRPVPLALVEAWLGAQTSALADIQTLPAERRRQLAEMLLASSGRASVGRRLRDAAVDDPTGLESLLDRSDALARRARAAVGEQTNAATPVAPLVSEPVAEPRPPARQRSEDRSAHQADEPAAVAPPVRPVVAPPVAQPPAADAPVPGAQPQPFVQPDDGGDDDRPRQAAEQPVPGVGTELPEPTPTDSPPAFNQPIFEDPTETAPPLTPGPQGSDPEVTPGPSETAPPGP